MMQTEQLDVVQPAPKHLIADDAWDPTDDELDAKWAQFESGWDKVPQTHDPIGRRLVGFAAMSVSVVVLGLVVGVVWVALSQV